MNRNLKGENTEFHSNIFIVIYTSYLPRYTPKTQYLTIIYEIALLL
jgi:hypothetical protein